ncbi:MAG: hypothetical protein IJY15_07060, partial [Thermoguttaceae bacterium]|nr:hypothetical protein [Thermoguttaceae bacterium]
LFLVFVNIFFCEIAPYLRKRYIVLSILINKRLKASKTPRRTAKVGVAPNRRNRRDRNNRRNRSNRRDR